MDNLNKFGVNEKMKKVTHIQLDKLKRLETSLPSLIESEGKRAIVYISLDTCIDWSGLGTNMAVAEAHFVSQRFIENGVSTLRWVFEGSVYL